MNKTRRKKKMRKQRRIIRFLARNFMVIFLIFVSVLLVQKVFAHDTNLVNISEIQTKTQLDKNSKTTKNEKSKNNTIPHLNQEAIRIYNNNKALLTLVNKEHVCQEQIFPLREICKGRLEAADILYSDLCQMLMDADNAGYRFWIASAYRSAQKQQALVNEDVANAMEQGLTYEDALAKTYEETMPAGYSEHQTGLALDILSAENMKMDISQENTPQNQWLQKHCYEYGFILRYPKEKESITKIAYEPWHFRYVGKQAAKYMKEKQLTLEEFYEQLRNPNL